MKARFLLFDLEYIIQHEKLIIFLYSVDMHALFLVDLLKFGDFSSVLLKIFEIKLILSVK